MGFLVFFLKNFVGFDGMLLGFLWNVFLDGPKVGFL